MIPTWLIILVPVGALLGVVIVLARRNYRRMMTVEASHLAEPPPEPPKPEFLGIVGDDDLPSFPDSDLPGAALIEAQFEGPPEPVRLPDAQELAWRAANTRTLSITLHRTDVEELERLGKEITEHGWGVLGTPASRRGRPPFVGAPTPEKIVHALIEEIVQESRWAADRAARAATAAVTTEQV